jgi:hypothetical protein
VRRFAPRENPARAWVARISGVAIATADVRISNGADVSQELKNRTKKFALDVIGLCAGLPAIADRSKFATQHSDFVNFVC